MCEAKGNLYAVMKEILRRMYGLDLGGVRAPLANLAPEDEAIVSFVTGRQKLLGRGFGDRKTIRSLLGGTGEDVGDQGLDQVDGYGELAGMDEQRIKDRIAALVGAGILKRGVYHTLISGKE